MFFIHEKKCPICKKKFPVSWPELWAYKTGGEEHHTFYCSWTCYRTAEKKASMGRERRKKDE